jgi:hypothetical protein
LLKENHLFSQLARTTKYESPLQNGGIARDEEFQGAGEVIHERSYLTKAEDCVRRKGGMT